MITVAPVDIAMCAVCEGRMNCNPSHIRTNNSPRKSPTYYYAGRNDDPVRSRTSDGSYRAMIKNMTTEWPDYPALPMNRSHAKVVACLVTSPMNDDTPSNANKMMR